MTALPRANNPVYGLRQARFCNCSPTVKLTYVAAVGGEPYINRPSPMTRPALSLLATTNLHHDMTFLLPLRSHGWPDDVFVPADCRLITMT